MEQILYDAIDMCINIYDVCFLFNKILCLLSKYVRFCCFIRYGIASDVTRRLSPVQKIDFLYVYIYYYYIYVFCSEGRLACLARDDEKECNFCTKHDFFNFVVLISYLTYIQQK